MSPGHRLPRAIRVVLPPLAMVLVALAVVAPVLPRLRTRLVGAAGDVDFTGHIWHCWWFGRSLLRLESPYTCDHVLYPFGSQDLLIKSGPAVNAALTAPFQPLLGVIGSYNAVLVLLLAFNGYGAFLLARHLTGHRLAAGLAGVLAILNPYVLFEASVGRMDQASMGWLYLALLAFLRLLERPGPGRGLVAGVAAFAAALSYLGYGQILLLAMAVILAVRLVSRRRLPDRDTLVGLGVMGLVFVALMSPLLVAFGRSMASLDPSSVQHLDLPLILHSPGQLTDVERVIVRGSAPVTSLLWSSATYEGPRLVLPLSVLALAILAASRSRGARPWALLAGVFLVLSLGPYLWWSTGTPPGPWPLPALPLYELVPTLSRMRFPSRFLVVTWASLVVLFAWALVALEAGVGRRWSRWLQVAALVLVVGEPLARGLLALPLPAGKPPPPSSYHLALAGHSGCAVVGVPIAAGKPTPEEEQALPVPTWQALEMYLQSVHQHPILAGHWVAFEPPAEHAALLEDNPLLASIRRIQRGDDPIPGGARGAEALRGLGFCQVAVTWPWFPHARRKVLEAYLADVLGRPQHFPDADISVYPLGPEGVLEEPAGGR